MIDVAPYQLEIINAILQKHVPYCEVRAFGSRVTWTAKDYSDLDLAIVGKKKLADKILYALKEDFEESDLPFRVDVLDWNSISDEFRDVINKGYEVLQKKGNKFRQTEIGEIPEEWEVVKIGDVSKFQYGLGESAQKKGEFVYIRITDIKPDGTLNKNNLAYISKKKVKKSCVLRKGDVLIARTGATYGKTYLFNEDFNAVYGGFLIKFLLDSKIVNSDFLFQFSRSKTYWDQANNLVGGGAQPQFNANAISELKLPLPSLSEQSAITKILSDLDSKIELNQQMNKTLEAIGQALFKRWFVDFEFPCLPENYLPACSAQAGKFSGAGEPNDMNSVCKYKSVGGLPAPQTGKYFIYALLCNDESFYIGITDDIYRRWYEHKTGQGAKWTKANEPIKVIHYEECKSRSNAAERERWLKTGFGRKWLKREYDKYLRRKAGLPAPECKLRQAGEMADSELEEIPKGWGIGILNDCFSITMGQSPPGSSYNEKSEGIIFFQGKTDFSLRYPNERVYCTAPTRFAEAGDTLVRVRAPVGDINMALEKCCIGRGLSAIRHQDGCRCYTYYFILSLQNILRSFESDGTVFGSISKGKFENISVIIPPINIINEFEKRVCVLDERIEQNEKQSRGLTDIRDSLLPRLMSGRIMVK